MISDSNRPLRVLVSPHFNDVVKVEINLEEDHIASNTKVFQTITWVTVCLLLAINFCFCSSIQSMTQNSCFENFLTYVLARLHRNKMLTKGRLMKS